MKRGVLLVTGLWFTFLVVSMASAQYEGYKEIEMQSAISSDISLSSSSSSAVLEYLSVNLSLFPRQDDYQDAEIDIQTYPETDEIFQGKTILIYWRAFDDRYSYKIVSNVKRKVEFAKIKNKILFPYTFEEVALLPYLEETEHIDITEKISDKAQEIVGDEQDYYNAVFMLAKWVNENIAYNMTTLTAEAVQSSSWVLENREGVCDELTNLFISFARSLGMPARFVVGQAYSNMLNGFGNHGWAEVYFPGYGWVPFDVTYGQFGYVDATHIKFKDAFDSGEHSIDYQWKVKDIMVEFDELAINTNILNTGGAIEQLVKIDVEPGWNKVGNGSYVPVIVEIENLADFYVPLTLTVIKAPGIEGKTTKHVLLEPKEQRKEYFIVKIPELVEEHTLYTTTVEVASIFSSASAALEYSAGYEFHSKEDARDFVEIFEMEKGEYLQDILLDCETENEYYYENESAIVMCELLPEIVFDYVNVCIDETCKTVNNVSEPTLVLLQKNFTKSSSVVAFVEHGGKKRYEFFKVNVIKPAVLEISEIRPVSIGYNERTNLAVKLDGFAKNVSIRTAGITGNVDEVVGSVTITLPISGKDVYTEKIHFQVMYEDDVGKRYAFTKTFELNVTDVPWYMRIVAFFRKFVE